MPRRTLRSPRPPSPYANRHAERQPGHHETRRDMKTAEPAPQHAARHGERDDDREQRAGGREVIAERDKIGHEIRREDRLDAVERETGEGQIAQIRRRHDRGDRGAEIGQAETPRRRPGRRRTARAAAATSPPRRGRRPPVASIAPRQPHAAAIAGPRNPASSSPAGTAVCLIENTSGARRGGDTRPSSCELVGVETAAPPPPIDRRGGQTPAARPRPPPPCRRRAVPARPGSSAMRHGG